MDITYKDGYAFVDGYKFKKDSNSTICLIKRCSVNILDTFWEENLKASALRLLDPFYEIIKFIL